MSGARPSSGGCGLDEVGYRGADHQRVSNRTWQQPHRGGVVISRHGSPHGGVHGIGRAPTIPSLRLGISDGRQRRFDCGVAHVAFPVVSRSVRTAAKAAV